jgi:16S rRNA (guanine527-N7)-methyltransferase
VITSLVEPIASGAAALGVSLGAGTAERLARLVTLILRYNARVNLVGRCTPAEAVDRHVHDSLALLRLLDEAPADAHEQWYDIGAGGGFPGLVLATARPRLRLTLVEPIAKKAALVRQAAHELGLTHATVVAARVEALPVGGPRAAVSRATFSPGEWLRRGSALVGPGGLVLVCMGGQADAQIEAAATRVDRFALPLSGAARVNALVTA